MNISESEYQYILDILHSCIDNSKTYNEVNFYAFLALDFIEEFRK